jgi:hypothetical protein
MPTNAQPWKKRREIPDMQVLDAAEQYDDASRLLDAQGAGAGVLLPLMNAAIISVELFLKSLSSESVFVRIDIRRLQSLRFASSEEAYPRRIV